jgi:iron complex transport system permease protein
MIVFFENIKGYFRGWSAAARIILPGGAELPVGVVAALLDGPFFCLLLGRRNRGGAA